MLTKISLKENRLSGIAAVAVEDNNWLDLHKAFEQQEVVAAMEHDLDTKFKALGIVINHFEHLNNKENVSQEDIATFNIILADAYRSVGISEESYRDNLVVSEEGIIDAIGNIFKAVIDFIKKIFSFIGEMISKFIDWITSVFSGKGGGRGPSTSTIKKEAENASKKEEEVKEKGAEKEYKKAQEDIAKEKDFKLGKETLLAIYTINKVYRNILNKDTFPLDNITNIDAGLIPMLDNLITSLAASENGLKFTSRFIKSRFDCEDVKLAENTILNTDYKTFLNPIKNILNFDTKTLEDKINETARKQSKHIIYVKTIIKKYDIDEIEIEATVSGAIDTTNGRKFMTCGTHAPDIKIESITVKDNPKINPDLKLDLNTDDDVKDLEEIISKNIEGKLDKYHKGVVDSFRSVEKAITKFNNEINKLKNISIDFGKKNISTRYVKEFTRKFFQIYKETFKAISVEVTNNLTVAKKIIVLEEIYLTTVKTAILEAIKLKKEAADKVLK